MDRSIVFSLLAVEWTQDSIGQWKEEVSQSTVYGQIASVSMDEFFSGGQNGYKPEYRITMFGPDYNDEQRCEIDGVEYSIYRVYRGRTDTVELYVERRTGDKQAVLTPQTDNPVPGGDGPITPVQPGGGEIA